MAVNNKVKESCTSISQISQIFVGGSNSENANPPPRGQDGEGRPVNNGRHTIFCRDERGRTKASSVGSGEMSLIPQLDGAFDSPPRRQEQQLLPANVDESSSDEDGELPARAPRGRGGVRARGRGGRGRMAVGRRGRGRGRARGRGRGRGGAGRATRAGGRGGRAVGSGSESGGEESGEDGIGPEQQLLPANQLQPLPAQPTQQGREVRGVDPNQEEIGHRIRPVIPEPDQEAGRTPEEDGWKAIGRVGAWRAMLNKFQMLEEVPEQHKGVWVWGFSDILRRMEEDEERALMWFCFLPQAPLRKPGREGRQGPGGQEV